MDLYSEKLQKITNPVPIDNNGFLAYPPYVERKEGYPRLRGCPEIMNLKEYILKQVPPVKEQDSWSSAWDGTADTSWYYNNPDAQSWTLTTAEQLVGLSVLLEDYESYSDFAGKTIHLGRNILLNDLSNFSDWHNSPPANNWIPIGAVSSSSRWLGKFDGHGYTIRGCYCKRNGHAGVFSNLYGWSVWDPQEESSYNTHCSFLRRQALGPARRKQLYLSRHGS